MSLLYAGSKGRAPSVLDIDWPPRRCGPPYEYKVAAAKQMTHRAAVVSIHTARVNQVLHNFQVAFLARENERRPAACLHGNQIQ